MSESDMPEILSAPIQAQTIKTSAYLPLRAGQTVCTVKDEKGKPCHGHVKQWYTAPKEAREKAAAGNTLHRCVLCAAIYEGPEQEYLHPTNPSAKKK